MFRRKAEDLIVRANCTSSIRNCVIKNVTDIILPFSVKSDIFYKTDFALLILKKPIPYSDYYIIPKVQSTEDYTRINKSRCFITRWQYKPCPRSNYLYIYLKNF